MLGVTLPMDEYRCLQSVNQPNKFTLALAEKLYGMEQLSTATVTGKDATKKLDPQITLAIKNEVLRVFWVSFIRRGEGKNVEFLLCKYCR